MLTIDGNTIIVSGIKKEDNQFIEIVDFIKGFKNRKFDWKEKTWTIELTIDNLIYARDYLQENKQRFLNEKKIQNETVNEIINICTKRIPLKFKDFVPNENIVLSDSKLFPHQKRMLHFLYETYQNHLLGWEMGTMKTRPICDLFNCNIVKYGFYYSVLIVCPLNVIKVWTNELSIVFGINEDKFIIPNGTKSNIKKMIGKSKSQLVSVCIINYEKLYNYLDSLIDANFSAIVFDESHRIKDIKSKCTQSAMKLSEKRKNVFCISGTFIANSEMDIFTQAYCVNPLIFGDNFFKFRSKYFDDIGQKRIYVNGRLKRIPEYKFKENMRDDFNEKLEYFVTSIKLDDCVDLPPMVYEKRYFNLDRTQLKYTEMIKNGIDENGNISDIKNSLTKLMQITSGFLYPENKIENDIINISNSKINCLLETISDIDVNSKIIIWITFVYERLLVYDALEKEKISAINYAGNNQEIEAFKHTDIRVLIAPINMLSEGVNLTCANVSIYYSQTFSIIKRSQSEFRIHRNGQKDKAVIIDLIGNNSIDQYVNDVMFSKKTMFENISENTTIREVVKLLKK